MLILIWVECFCGWRGRSMSPGNESAPRNPDGDGSPGATLGLSTVCLWPKDVRQLAFLQWGVERLSAKSSLRKWVAQAGRKSPCPVAGDCSQPVQLPRLEVHAFGSGQVLRDGQPLTMAALGTFDQRPRIILLSVGAFAESQRRNRCAVLARSVDGTHDQFLSCGQVPGAPGVGCGVCGVRWRTLSH